MTLYDSNDSKIYNTEPFLSIKMSGPVDDAAHTLPYNCDMHAYSHLPATHLDLGKILMPYYGYYIFPNTLLPSTSATTEIEGFDIGENQSDYYGLPLIELKPQEYGSNIIPLAPPTFGPEKPIIIPLTVDEVEDSDEEEDKLEFPPLHQPREVPPGQAIMIYLLYRGTPLSTIAQSLSTLHKDFVITEGKRWILPPPAEDKGIRRRLPQHSQLNEKIIEEVMAAAHDKPWQLWMERLEILDAMVKKGNRKEEFEVEVAKIKVWKRMRVFNVEVR